MTITTLLQDVAAVAIEQPAQYVFVEDAELAHVGGGAGAVIFF